MSATCPTCGKPVDTLRSRHVKVRGIQVVAYCSAECLGQAEPSVPVVVPTVPDSGPVIEIRYEPASGVVTSAPDKRTGPVPKVEPDIPKVDLGKLQKQEEKEKKDKSDRIVKVNPPKRKSEPKLAVVKPPEPKPEPEPKKKPSTPELKPVDKKRLEVIEQTSTPKGSGTSLASGDKKGGPRKRGRETMQRDDSNASQSEDWLDDEPANVGAVRAGTDLGDIEPPKSGSGKKVLVTLLVVALLAGAGVIAYRMMQSSKTTTKSSGSGSPATGPSGSGSGSGSGSAMKPRVVGPGSDVDVAPPDKDQQVAKATAVLRRYLDPKNTERIQRISAIALAWIHDKAAIDWLGGALATSPARFSVAQALARAGDKRGLDALYAALSQSRDDRLEAASKLAELGDKRGADTLANYLDVSQNRFGAATSLARIGDTRGIKVLEQIRADAKTSADDKARATIALGFAGQDVAEDLRKLLVDTHFNIDAAEALVLRHDEAARAPLSKQLEVTSLRGRAARALRTLGPNQDFSGDLRMLTSALEAPANQHDTELIPIAEAILMLGAPMERT